MNAILPQLKYKLFHRAALAPPTSFHQSSHRKFALIFAYHQICIALFAGQRGLFIFFHHQRRVITDIHETTHRGLWAPMYTSFSRSLFLSRVNHITANSLSLTNPADVALVSRTNEQTLLPLERGQHPSLERLQCSSAHAHLGTRVRDHAIVTFP